MYYEALKELGAERADALAEVAADKRLKQLTAGVIREHPFQFVWMSVNRFIRLWFNIGYGYTPSLMALLVFWGQAGIVCLAFYGYFLHKGLWRRRFEVAGLLIVYVTLVHSSMHAAYRYVVPVMPFVLMVCAHTVIRIWRQTGKQSSAATARI
jgi:hypothetical protein